MSSKTLFGFFFTLMLEVSVSYPTLVNSHPKYAPYHHDAGLVHNHPAPLHHQQTAVLHPGTVEHQTVPVKYVHTKADYHQPQYHSRPVLYAKIDPTTHSDSTEYNHGGYDQVSSGHTSNDYNDHSDKATHRNSAATFHGHHGNDGHNSHGTQVGNLNHHGTYRNVGSYSEDKGSGFEKSYSFDTATGYHDIEADNYSASQEHGSQKRQHNHSVGDHSTETHEAHGAHSKTENNEHGSQIYNKSLFEKYGYSNSKKDQGYSYSPLYGYGYH